MARDSEKFNKSVRKLKKEIAETYGLDVNDDGFKESFAEVLKKISSDRVSKYNDRILKKYPVELVRKTFDWATDNLSSSEYENSNFEETMLKFLGTNPPDVSLKDFERIFNKKSGGLKPFVKDPFGDDCRWPDVDHIEKTGEVRELPLEGKRRPAPPAMPSQQQLKTMSVDEIGKLIKVTRAAAIEE